MLELLYGGDVLALDLVQRLQDLINASASQGDSCRGAVASIARHADLLMPLLDVSKL